MNNELSPEITETILAYPRWFTNGQRWYTAWRPNGEVRAFLLPNETPTVEETEDNWEVGIKCEPFTKKTIQEMVVFEAIVHYFATGKDIGLVVFEFGTPYSDETNREEFDVEVVLDEDGAPVGAKVKPVSERVMNLWQL